MSSSERKRPGSKNWMITLNHSLMKVSIFIGPSYLAKVQSITNIRTHGFCGSFIFPRITAAIIFSFSKS